MKIYVHRTHTVMDGLVIRWNVSPWPYAGLQPEISASRNSVMISGHWELRNPDDYATFGLATVDAFAAHTQLREADRGRLFGNVAGPPRYPNEVDVRFGETLDQVIERQTKERARG